MRRRREFHETHVRRHRLHLLRGVARPRRRFPRRRRGGLAQRRERRLVSLVRRFGVRAAAALLRGGGFQSRCVRVQSGQNVVAERAPLIIRRHEVRRDVGEFRRDAPLQRVAQRIQRLPQLRRDGVGRGARRLRRRPRRRRGFGALHTKRVRGELGSAEVRGGALGGIARAPRFASLLCQLFAQARRFVVPPVTQQSRLVIETRREPSFHAARVAAVLPRASGRSVERAGGAAGVGPSHAFLLRRRQSPATPRVEWIHVLPQALEQRRDSAQLVPRGEVAAAACGAPVAGPPGDDAGRRGEPRAERADFAFHQLPGRARDDAEGVPASRVFPLGSGDFARRPDGGDCGDVDAGKQVFRDVPVDGRLRRPAASQHVLQRLNRLIALGEVRLQRAELGEQNGGRGGRRVVFLGARARSRRQALREQVSDAARRFQRYRARLRVHRGDRRRRRRGDRRGLRRRFPRGPGPRGHRGLVRHETLRHRRAVSSGVTSETSRGAEKNASRSNGRRVDPGQTPEPRDRLALGGSVPRSVDSGIAPIKKVGTSIF